MEPKRLYRSITDRRISGVAGGLADYLSMDPLLVRLIFVILAIAGGGGLLIYIILWIVTPEEPYSLHQKQEKPYTEPTPDSGEPISEESVYTQESGRKGPPVTPASKPKSKGSVIGGLVLITLGALFLADEFIPRLDFGDLWPVILVVIGIGLLINAVSARKPKN
jgi:phage shock protein C